jgi:hypothetical protein
LQTRIWLTRCLFLSFDYHFNRINNCIIYYSREFLSNGNAFLVCLWLRENNRCTWQSYRFEVCLWLCTCVTFYSKDKPLENTIRKSCWLARKVWYSTPKTFCAGRVPSGLNIWPHIIKTRVIISSKMCHTCNRDTPNRPGLFFLNGASKSSKKSLAITRGESRWTLPIWDKPGLMPQTTFTWLKFKWEKTLAARWTDIGRCLLNFLIFLWIEIIYYVVNLLSQKNNVNWFRTSQHSVVWKANKVFTCLAFSVLEEA